MTNYLCARKIRIFDYPQFAQPLHDELREHAEHIVVENGIASLEPRRGDAANHRRGACRPQPVRPFDNARVLGLSEETDRQTLSRADNDGHRSMEHPTPTDHDVAAGARAGHLVANSAWRSHRRPRLNSRHSTRWSWPSRRVCGLRDRVCCSSAGRRAAPQRTRRAGCRGHELRARGDREAPAQASRSRWEENKRRVRSGRCAAGSTRRR
jgi:hypothetical protein